MSECPSSTSKPVDNPLWHKPTQGRCRESKTRHSTQAHKQVLCIISGFDNAIIKWGTGTEASIARDLKWQREMDSNAQKITQFKEVVGGLQDFCTYLFMKPGSAFVTVMHSPMKFVAISDATQHLQGRYIGFVGDRTATKDPTSIILPQ